MKRKYLRGVWVIVGEMGVAVEKLFLGNFNSEIRS